jgi:hypothetical protein
MIWMYERGAEVLRIETRFDAAASQFELIWHRPDGTTQVEKFSNETAFRARLESVEAALKTEHWNQAGPPKILREGWKEGNDRK